MLVLEHEGLCLIWLLNTGSVCCLYDEGNKDVTQLCKGQETVLQIDAFLLFSIGVRFANVLVYYGLSLNISDFGMNIYLTQMIFGLVEMPARTITLFTLNRSRKISQLAFLAVGGTACLLTIFIPSGMDSLHVYFFQCFQSSRSFSLTLL